MSYIANNYTAELHIQDWSISYIDSNTAELYRLVFESTVSSSPTWLKFIKFYFYFTSENT